LWLGRFTRATNNVNTVVTVCFTETTTYSKRTASSNLTVNPGDVLDTGPVCARALVAVGPNAPRAAAVYKALASV
jgi:hypothetical protein